MTTATRKTPAATTDPTQLRRVAKQYAARRVAFWNRASGELVSTTGNGTTLAPDAPLSTVLHIIAGMSAPLRPRTLFIIGGESAATTPRRSWWAEPATLDQHPRWRYDGYELAAHAATGGVDATENAGEYQLHDEYSGACHVDVRMSALWFPGVTSARECRDAWNALNAALARTFDEKATLLATPAMTGLDLLQRSLPERVAYPQAPDELRELLHSISGQGRFEFCPDPQLQDESIPGLWTLDARWMYAACVRHLPTGTPTHTLYSYGGADADEAYAPYKAGWYRIDTRVPPSWRHRGLISTVTQDERVWPAEPGQWVRDVWTTGAELALALRSGWPCLIHERWLYESAWPAEVGTNRLPPYAADPTRQWSERLRTLRSAYTNNAPIASAIRHLLIDTVGMWHRTAGEKLRITPLAQYPGSAFGRLHHVDRAQGLAYWYEPKPLSRDALAWQRPEWSTTVWGRARARLNEAALRIPRSQLVAYRADALITCYEPPAQIWLDDGQPGTFRLKEHLPGPLSMPRDLDALQQLRRAAKAEAKREQGGR